MAERQKKAGSAPPVKGEAEEDWGGERGGSLFYVRRQTCAVGSFEWYVPNGHTRRRARGTFKTKAAAETRRVKLQAKLDLAKAKVRKVEC
jgi:hypothetical protein